MIDWFGLLLPSDRFMPHGICYLWERDLVALHVVSDVAIGLACYAIPPALVFLLVALPGAGKGTTGEAPLVLVVEDNADLRGYLCDVFARRYRVATAADGDAGLRVARERLPDIVVTDLMMPGLPGAELVHELQRAPETGPAVLVLTARGEVDLRASLLRGGTSDYLLKPFSPGELLTRVDNLVATRRTRQLLQGLLDSQEESLERLAARLGNRNRELELALRQNRILLREVHHRVKGNLQTVSSLLRLQAGNSDDPGLQAILHDAVGRVQAIALLHEKLYREGSIEHVEFGSYARDLVSTLVRTGAASGKVDLSFDSPDFELPVDEAIPLALLVYEIVANALRHAFEPGRPGRLEVRLAIEDDEVAVEVGDDGPGLPGDIDVEAPTTSGLQIVDALAEQLHADRRVLRDAGTRFVFHFRSAGAREVHRA